MNSSLALRKIYFLSILLFFGAASPAMSCTPMAPKAVGVRMKQIFKESSEIVIATVVSVEKYKAKLPLGSGDFLENPAERVVFRVDRVLKGSLAPGDKYVTETLLGGGSCGISANAALVYVMNENQELVPKKHSNQWLLSIYPSQRHQLISGNKPIEMAIEDGELEILESLLAKSRKP